MFRAVVAGVALGTAVPVCGAPAEPGEADRATDAGAEHPLRTEPLWEVGVGGFTAYVPDYPAAEESRFIGLGVPYAIYRGDLVRIGEDSLATVVPLDEDRYELDLSFDAAFRADSDGNEAREGMPDLDFLLEAGPQLIVRIAQWDQGAGQASRLEFALQVRAVASTDFGSLDHRGFVLQPGLTYEHDRIADTPVDASVSVAPIWATERLHDFFYEVDPEFATAERPAFDAGGGYLGTEVDVALEYPVTGSFSLFLGGQAGLYQGAANRDSPLFRDSLTFSGGVGLTWSFLQSDERVRR